MNTLFGEARMAKGRFISKDISLDEKLNELPDDTARLLFTWMIPHLDCEGRIHGDAQTFKSIVMPRRHISINKIEKYLENMAKLQLILRYSVNGNKYICAKNFEKHQIGLKKEREAQSRIPAPNPEPTQDLILRKSGLPPSQVKVKVKDKVYTYFARFWELYPNKKSKARAEQAFAKIKPDEALLAVILAAIERAKKSKQWTKDNGEFIPYPATWLNARGWEDEINVTVGAKSLPTTEQLEQSWG